MLRGGTALAQHPSMNTTTKTTECEPSCDAKNTGVCNCWQADMWTPAAVAARALRSTRTKRKAA